MISNVFVDSSILVEYIKGRKFGLLTRLIESEETCMFINETVVSEFMLYFVAHFGNAAPRSLKSSNKINELLTEYTGFSLLSKFQFLQSSKLIYKAVPDLMSKYNLLPNDAIIIATCKIHNIDKIASHDTDFTLPCSREGIELLTEQ